MPRTLSCWKVENLDDGILLMKKKKKLKIIFSSLGNFCFLLSGSADKLGLSKLKLVFISPFHFSFPLFFNFAKIFPEQKQERKQSPSTRATSGKTAKVQKCTPSSKTKLSEDCLLAFLCFCNLKLCFCPVPLICWPTIKEHRYILNQ